MLAPPQSLQTLLMRLCWQMLVPPQSLQVLLMRLCWQMPVPPQSLQVLLLRICWQMPVPPQSLQVLLVRLCGQMLVPPQSLQVLLMRLCGQMLVPPCYWVTRWTLALNPAVGATAHESGDGRKHTRLLGSTRESSTVLVLEAPNKPLAPLPPGCLPDGGHPSPVGPSYPIADMPPKSGGTPP